MTSKIYDIHDCLLNIPPFDENDWEAAVEKATGNQREILRIQFNLLLLLKDISDHQASFERLAWFSIWVKEMSILEAAFVAYESDSEFLLEILNRLSFELQIHLLTIMSPRFRADSRRAQTEKNITADENDSIKRKAAIVDRLRAYTAWCLCNDLGCLRELLRPNTLDLAWNSEPAKSIINDPVKYKKYRQLFGDIDIETDEKVLRKGFFKQRDHALHNKHRLNTWLNHSDLAKWKRKIDRLIQSNRQSPSFFSLFNETEKSICRRLEGMNMRYAYTIYKQSSLLIHGSSIQTHIWFNENRFTLKSMKDKDAANVLMKSLCRACMNVLLGLKLIQSELWN